MKNQIWEITKEVTKEFAEYNLSKLRKYKKTNIYFPKKFKSLKLWHKEVDKIIEMFEIVLDRENKLKLNLPIDDVVHNHVEYEKKVSEGLKLYTRYYMCFAGVKQ